MYVGITCLKLRVELNLNPKMNEQNEKKLLISLQGDGKYFSELEI